MKKAFSPHGTIASKNRLQPSWDFCFRKEPSALMGLLLQEIAFSPHSLCHGLVNKRTVRL